ncbi:hypothetical protein PYCCODRAFT_169123 [Trametes coccinea BRFM310]|uniref:Uncharacterized protein n=1 Tax=Trametes coccinea (strain BRFM310) TaxID=1353009 RepID=A0A1Y2ITJ7_TRAC3|nr:hypothetical protein PYCCODRAFT_169123 [Trametes coccinea BRFM310]
MRILPERTRSGVSNPGLACGARGRLEQKRSLLRTCRDLSLPTVALVAATPLSRRHERSATAVIRMLAAS